MSEYVKFSRFLKKKGPAKKNGEVPHLVTAPTQLLAAIESNDQPVAEVMTRSKMSFQDFGKSLEMLRGLGLVEITEDDAQQQQQVRLTDLGQKAQTQRT